MQRLLWVLILALPLAGADLKRHSREGNLFKLELTEGAGEIEWVSTSSFRYTLRWRAPLEPRMPANRDPVDVDVRNRASQLEFRTRYLTVALLKKGLTLSVRDADGETLMADASPVRRQGGKVIVERTVQADEKFYGLGIRAVASPDLRGSLVESSNPLLLSSAGYGLYYEAQGTTVFDLAKGNPKLVRTLIGEGEELSFFFHYGPSPKEILEERHSVTPTVRAFRPRDAEFRHSVPSHRSVYLMPAPAGTGWEAVSEWVHSLVHAGFSGVLVPAFDLSAFRQASDEVYRRAAQLSLFLPVSYSSVGAASEPAGRRGVQQRLVRDRKSWTPYLMAYLDEARERGLPVVRPLAVRFSKDAEGAKIGDQFMLGDEVLVAPVLSPGSSRRVYLPMGRWTDFRTNRAYAGRQYVEVETVKGSIPFFVKNGSILPLETAPNRLQIHYFPNLAAEFFLYEPDLNDVTQLHAAPAGDYMRFEMNSKIEREYAWVAHHVPAVRGVESGGQTYSEARAADALKPGQWFYDKARGNLHVTVKALVDRQVIVNVTFQ